MMDMSKTEDKTKSHPAAPASSEPAKGPAPASKSEPPAESAAALQSKLSEYENDLKRLAAEFDNYKKRVEKEKAEARARGKAEALAPFLEMAETFEQALAHAEKKEGSSMKEGLVLLHRKLHSILASCSVREIECKGLPNHAYHDVMLQVPGTPDGEIAQCLRKGYVMGEYVLRPAQVAVFAAEPKEKKEEENKGGSSEPRQSEEKKSRQ
ncbi:Protein GrpE [uncultured archaeon]|nr:Protein GrpE [uncultured archaeon]